ncbi:hypothetical protein LSAT2_023485 [Lamellibrachia satsuma]|nr:hypothetical protein LSAT2_023485 [Lamellibrachia satsuma]
MATTSEIVKDVLLEDKLIQMWPDYPCLYDVRSAAFKNRNVRQLAMEEIAGKLEQNVDWVKNKLRLLRNSFTKARKAPRSGSARKTPSRRTTWLLESLQFLAPYVAGRPSISNLDSPSPTPTTDSETIVDAGDDVLNDDTDDDTLSQDEPLAVEHTTPKSTQEPPK